ncbi:GNAT family N-acetyltransferase [Labedaea rhizosphaerae]|uniref:Acetyltransferase (GNAT) family protein n=1 Tax=Labedaea rhizosphaerae TaxID=598644 RepID=A0A4R6SAE8_LABRH|nr:GNAT family N-acetyltransferase [Labedaea rhizosphaerae]TDP96801.1 acetyltransferase (GNAT) family protein [Labedaea rhizosphaerae]
MKIKEYLGFRVAKCDVDEALTGAWRDRAGEIDIVRVSAPPVTAWPRLRRAGFVCKPKLIRWYAEVDGYRERLSRKDRWNLRNAERLAEQAGLRGEVVSPIDAAFMDEFLELYKERIAEMRRGLDVAGGIRDSVIADDSYRAVVARHPDGSLAGAVIGRPFAGDGAFRVNVSAVTPHWRKASLTRTLYARAAELAREHGLPRVSAGTDPNVFGLIAEPGLYSFKSRLGFRPTAPEELLPDEAEHEADLVLRLDQLSDPALIVGYAESGDGLVLHVFSHDPDLDLRHYTAGLAHAPVLHHLPQEASSSCRAG